MGEFNPDSGEEKLVQRNVNFSGAANGAGLKASGVIVPVYEFVEDFQSGQSAASWAASHTCWVADPQATWQVKSVSAVFGTASSSGTLQVEVATGTTAMGSGTNQLTGTVSLAGSANTTVTGTVIASPTTITAGSRLNLIFGGTVTNLVNCCVEICLQRVS